MAKTTITRLQFLLQEKEWSQSYLAQIAGVHQAKLSEWIRGKNVPSMEDLQLLAEALDVKDPKSLLELGYTEYEWVSVDKTLEPVRARYSPRRIRIAKEKAKLVKLRKRAAELEMQLAEAMA